MLRKRRANLGCSVDRWVQHRIGVGIQKEEDRSGFYGWMSSSDSPARVANERTTAEQRLKIPSPSQAEKNATSREESGCSNRSTRCCVRVLPHQPDSSLLLSPSGPHLHRGIRGWHNRPARGRHRSLCRRRRRRSRRCHPLLPLRGGSTGTARHSSRSGASRRRRRRRCCCCGRFRCSRGTGGGSPDRCWLRRPLGGRRGPP